MRRLFATLAFLLPATLPVMGQGAATPLRDGQQVTLTGQLTMEPAGRLQFVTVKTAAAYVPVFKGGGDTQGQVLHEIGLAGYSDYARLYAYRGQQVTVTGTMSTDDATPYFWHGTRLKVSSIRLGDGVDLSHARQTTPEMIAVDVGTYQATVMLPSDLAAPWIYSANGQPVQEGRFLSCSSNGGGDVVNCYCAKGFRPVAGDTEMQGRRGQARLLQDLAQFDVGETPQRVEISVSCSR